MTVPTPPAPHRDLSRFAWLSIGAALATITLKTIAWQLTGSVGLLSDAAESVVNLVAGIVALIALKIAARPADDDHQFGHSKAEYFSAAIEGIMIFVAASLILVSAIERFLHPRAVENVDIGLVISVIASVINGVAAWVLLRAGRRYRSLTLTADGKHLLTDVWTSAGVVIGVLLVSVTGWQRLDPLLACAVAINIIFMGYKLVAESTMGLMDVVLPKEDNDTIVAVLQHFATTDVRFHGLRTRAGGRLRFARVDMLVPGAWTVRQGHDLLEDIEQSLKGALPDLEVTIHLEPLEDPRAYGDHPVEIPIAGAMPEAPRP